MTMQAGIIQRQARSFGFDCCGVAAVGPTPESLFYPEWLARGYAGEMRYLERQKPARMDPTQLLPGAKSVIVCAVNYNAAHSTTAHDSRRAWISRYAWGADYHETLKARLNELAAWIERESGGHSRTFVDTGPLLERVYARYAGIGWFGKNTCIINQGIGSWLFLGCVLTDLELGPDTAPPDRCGSCTRCLDACPTQAILEPYVLDSRKCISYLTIELRGEIAADFRTGIGQHLFGCDICQDVCPWNRKAAVSTDPAFQPKAGLFWPEVERLLELDEDEWRALIRGTAMTRARVPGLLRNLMVVAANSGIRSLRSKLERFLEHSDAAVRSHAAWALQRLSASPETAPCETEIETPPPAPAP